MLIRGSLVRVQLGKPLNSACLFDLQATNAVLQGFCSGSILGGPLNEEGYRNYPKAFAEFEPFTLIKALVWLANSTWSSAGSWRKNNKGSVKDRQTPSQSHLVNR